MSEMNDLERQFSKLAKETYEVELSTITLYLMGAKVPLLNNYQIEDDIFEIGKYIELICCFRSCGNIKLSGCVNSPLDWQNLEDKYKVLLEGDSVIGQIDRLLNQALSKKVEDLEQRYNSFPMYIFMPDDKENMYYSNKRLSEMKTDFERISKRYEYPKEGVRKRKRIKMLYDIVENDFKKCTKRKLYSFIYDCLVLYGEIERDIIKTKGYKGNLGREKEDNIKYAIKIEKNKI